MESLEIWLECCWNNEEQNYVSVSFLFYCFVFVLLCLLCFLF